jgi:hypothetical protein
MKGSPGCRVVEFLVECEVEPWERLGLLVHDGVAQVGGVRLRFVAGTGGLVAWGLADLPGTHFDGTAGSTADDLAIDGLRTYMAEPSDAAAPEHPLGIAGFDHVVVMTSSLERTCGAVEAITGAPLKRIREAGAIRQGFHRLGEIIVEVVESPQVTGNVAAFWGFVWNLRDLHDACDRLGPDIVSLPKAAVQPGRFIATVRPAVGARLPLAFMSVLD